MKEWQLAIDAIRRIVLKLNTAIWSGGLDFTIYFNYTQNPPFQPFFPTTPQSIHSFKIIRKNRVISSINSHLYEKKVFPSSSFCFIQFFFSFSLTLSLFILEKKHTVGLWRCSAVNFFLSPLARMRRWSWGEENRKRKSE